MSSGGLYVCLTTTIATGSCSRVVVCVGFCFCIQRHCHASVALCVLNVPPGDVPFIGLPEHYVPLGLITQITIKSFTSCMHQVHTHTHTHNPPHMITSRYDISDEQLRPYFSLPNVLDGLCALVKRLFDVDVAPADGLAPVWHPDVRFFSVSVAGQPKVRVWRFCVWILCLFAL